MTLLLLSIILQLCPELWTDSVFTNVRGEEVMSNESILLTFGGLTSFVTLVGICCNYGQDPYSKDEILSGRTILPTRYECEECKKYNCNCKKAQTHRKNNREVLWEISENTKEQVKQDVLNDLKKDKFTQATKESIRTKLDGKVKLRDNVRHFRQQGRGVAFFFGLIFLFMTALTVVGGGPALSGVAIGLGVVSGLLMTRVGLGYLSELVGLKATTGCRLCLWDGKIQPTEAIKNDVKALTANQIFNEISSAKSSTFRRLFEAKSPVTMQRLVKQTQ